MYIRYIEFIGLLTAAAVLGSCATRSTSSQSHPTSPGGFDRQFLQDKAHYYEEEANLAQLCIERAERLELRQFCQTVLASQKSYSSEVKNWLSTWYRSSGTDSKEEHSAEHYRRLMSDKGAAQWTFDRMILSATRLYHHHGVDDLRACVASASRMELVQWCRSTQSAEIKEMNQMTAWICSWFNDCVEGPMRE